MNEPICTRKNSSSSSHAGVLYIYISPSILHASLFVRTYVRTKRFKNTFSYIFPQQDIENQLQTALAVPDKHSEEKITHLLPVHIFIFLEHRTWYTYVSLGLSSRL